MALTESEVKLYLEDWARMYCRDSFDTGIPAGVRLFVEQGYSFITSQASGKTAESLGDYSVSYGAVTEFPKALTNLLVPYRKMGVI